MNRILGRSAPAAVKEQKETKSRQKRRHMTTAPESDRRSRIGRSGGSHGINRTMPIALVSARCTAGARSRKRETSKSGNDCVCKYFAFSFFRAFAISHGVLSECEP